MSITEAFTNSATISTTEKSLPANATYSSGSPQTADGFFSAFIDTANMAAGDEYIFRAYETVISGGTQRLVMSKTLVGAQSEPLIYTPPGPFLHGWDFTLLKVSGTDRSFAWSIRKTA